MERKEVVIEERDWPILCVCGGKWWWTRDAWKHVGWGGCRHTVLDVISLAVKVGARIR